MNDIEELKQRLERAEKALEQIEEIYMDGYDVHRDTVNMAKIAQNYFKYKECEEKSSSQFLVEDEVQIIKEGLTKGKFGIIQNIGEKIEVSFDENWVGWYEPQDLEKVPQSFSYFEAKDGRKVHVFED